MKKGICAISPGQITITLNAEFFIQTIELGGYCGNLNVWFPGNGSGASISFSKDGYNWIKVETIPTNFGSVVQKINITNNNVTKFIQFKHTSYLGIGFLKVYTDDGRFSSEDLNIVIKAEGIRISYVEYNQYKYRNQIAGDNTLNDLLNSNPKTGI